MPIQFKLEFVSSGPHQYQVIFKKQLRIESHVINCREI